MVASTAATIYSLAAVNIIRRREKASANPLGSYLYDPVAFIHDCIDFPKNGSTTEYQDKILSDLYEYKRVAARGCHGLGKTADAALAIIHFSLVNDAMGYDWKVPTTASVNRQLKKYLWPEVRKWLARVRWDKIGRRPLSRYEMQDMALKLDHGEAFAVSSDDPAYIEGAHADRLLYIFDEAKTIPDETWDAAEGAFSGAGPDTGNEAYALAISTPGPPSGRFHAIHKREKGLEEWHRIHVKIEEVVKAGRVSWDWVKKRARQWGEDSALFKNRVLGEFAEDNADGIIPISWVEAANERWHEWREQKLEWKSFRQGVDVAIGKEGRDKSTIALRFDQNIHTVRSYRRTNTMELVGRCSGIQNKFGGEIVIDVIGVGIGAYQRLQELGKPVIPFNAAEKTDLLDETGELGFVNKRSAGWWKLRELLNPENNHLIALPPDEDLLGDLTAPKYKVISGGRIQVEAKEDIKKRIKRSTDKGDSVMHAYFEPEINIMTAWASLPALAIIGPILYYILMGMPNGYFS